MNNWIVGVLAVSVVLLGAYVLTRPTVVTQSPQVGNSSSPAVIDGCQEINGATVCYYGKSFAQASTTCSFKLSTTASSTVLFAGASVTNAFGGTFDTEWGSATSPNATTTSLGYGAGVIANSGTFQATSTVWNNLNNEDATNIIPPGRYLNFKVGSSSPTVSGRCAAAVLVI